MMSEFTSATELAQALRAAEARRIGVDGSDGVGKTPLAQAIAGILRYQLFSLDDYLHKEQGAFVPNIHYDKLASDLAKAQSFVVEGVCLLQVLARAAADIDKLVYLKRFHLGVWADERELHLAEDVESFLRKERKFVGLLGGSDQPVQNLGLAEEIIRYHASYRPQENADFVYRRDDC